jgi:hypothetical protein
MIYNHRTYFLPSASYNLPFQYLIQYDASLPSIFLSQTVSVRKTTPKLKCATQSSPHSTSKILSIGPKSPDPLSANYIHNSYAYTTLLIALYNLYNLRYHKLLTLPVIPSKHNSAFLLVSTKQMVARLEKSTKFL